LTPFRFLRGNFNQNVHFQLDRDSNWQRFRGQSFNFVDSTAENPVQVELASKGYDREIIEAERITQLGKKITICRFHLCLKQFLLNYNIVNIIMKLKDFYTVTLNFY